MKLGLWPPLNGGTVLARMSASCLAATSLSSFRVIEASSGICFSASNILFSAPLEFPLLSHSKALVSLSKNLIIVF